MDAQACNQLVRDGGTACSRNCLKFSGLVKLPPPDLHIRAVFVGLCCLYFPRFLCCSYSTPCLGCGSRREPRTSWLSLPSFTPSMGLFYLFFFFKQSLKFLVRINKEKEIKVIFFLPPQIMCVSFISQMTEDVEIGPRFLMLISETQEL